MVASHVGVACSASAAGALGAQAAPLLPIGRNGLELGEVVRRAHQAVDVLAVTLHAAAVVVLRRGRGYHAELVEQLVQ